MKFDDVTLVTIECFYHDLARRAMEETLGRIPFKNVIVFSDKNFLPGATWVPIQPTNTMRDYCDILLKGMWPHVGTSHMIFQQWDAMVHNADAWTDEYLNYDYIGAVWPWRGEGQNVGNGGFSLRSRNLLNSLRMPEIYLDLEGPHGVQEDNYIAIEHRPMLEQNQGIRFAPTALADQFSHELNGTGAHSMAFHGFWNIVKFMPQDTVWFYIENAPANTWNEIHRAHHTIVALAEKGYLEMISSQADRIRNSTQYTDLMRWLAQEQFPNRDITLRILGF